MAEQSKKEDKNLPQKAGPTYSERFTQMVVREYSSSISSTVKLNEFQRKLAQHLFVKVDMALKDFDVKRLSKPNANQKPSFSWNNVNLEKLAVDTVHRIELSLDALIPNHVHPVPYLNGRTKKYDLDLRIGYAGKDYYHRQMSLYPIEDIIYELVYETDEFTVIKKTLNEGVESYNFEIPEPFARGEIVGGFGYIMYENKSLNKLIILTLADFEKSQKSAMSNDFWNKHPEAMRYKTIVHRTVSRIVLDPQKINESFATVENDELKAIDHQSFAEAEAEVEEFSNTEVIDIDRATPSNDSPEPEKADEPQTAEPSEDEQAAIHAREMSEAGTAYTPTNQEKVNDQEHVAAGGGPGF